jgi:hypothetical protein
MKLTKRTYVRNWDYMKPEERHQITVQKDGKSTAIKPERIEEITEAVGYWRKANQIHQWFIENCQGGVDDCRDAYVSEEKLTALLGLVEDVLADHSKAAELLPTQSGFFFGSDEYDEGYFSDLTDSKKIIEAALAEGGDGCFYYQSSW